MTTLTKLLIVRLGLVHKREEREEGGEAPLFPLGEVITFTLILFGMSGRKVNKYIKI